MVKEKSEETNYTAPCFGRNYSSICNPEGEIVAKFIANESVDALLALLNNGTLTLKMPRPE